MSGQVQGICTAPLNKAALNKAALNKAGHVYPGHTELRRTSWGSRKCP